MAIPVFNNTKIFVVCPANVATGGSESLHQLVYNLENKLKIDAKILYYNFNKRKYSTPVHPNYRIYNTSWVLDLSDKDDCENNILIVPEVYDACLILKKYSNIRKGIWFLSVDNYYFSRLSITNFFFQRLTNKLAEIFGSHPIFDIDVEKFILKNSKLRKDPLLKNVSFFLTNSYRSIAWLKKGGLQPIYYLLGYLNEEYFNSNMNFSKKENIVVYNPKKGFSFTKKIIKASPDIKFIPLINMTRQQVIETLQRAKVYIDFGNHPGKDRIPREAAILGCCVITGKRGSAKYFKDVPIPEEYKFEDKEGNIPKIINKIRDCFENFEERYKDFDYYRRIIKEEPKKFVDDLKKIFVKVDQ